MKQLTRVMIGVIALGGAFALRHARGDLQTPEWVLPVDTARAVAMRERKPLLVISLNGNLDANC